MDNSLTAAERDGIRKIIINSLTEDVGDGDHTSLATIPESTSGSAQLIVKEDGVIAGTELAALIFQEVDPGLRYFPKIHDGASIKKEDIAFFIEGNSRSILKAERLVLNFLQRMSGIATKTAHLKKLISHTKCKLLDTRKTTPGIRILEKWAVRIGGGHNHRRGLYDMILIKDNHIDYAGGISNAIGNTMTYLREKNLQLNIEIEARSLDEVTQIIKTGNVQRIMFDNFFPSDIITALKLIDRSKMETEASGGISENNIAEYAETGVDFISCGMLTHSVKSLDLSLKAKK